MLRKNVLTKSQVKKLPFPQILLKKKIAAILDRFGRYDSNLKVKLLYERAFNN